MIIVKGFLLWTLWLRNMLNLCRVICILLLCSTYNYSAPLPAWSFTFTCWPPLCPCVKEPIALYCAQLNLPETMQWWQNHIFMCSKNTSNIWWMAPMKPYGLQISCNVILLLVWFPSMTLCNEQSATFSKTQCQGSNIPRARKKYTHWNSMTPKQTLSVATGRNVSAENLLNGVY